ncbi:response regulator [Undibacterium sp. SXout7W]|uniref:response regulator n=1 Tax=Undibacterium sp. SXout7W TaxID=3413049 RepID=UPI003BF04E0A
MTSAQILIIEDDVKIAALLSDYFIASGYQVTHQSTGWSGLEAIRSNAPDLVLLDLMLPELDGIEVCRQTRLFSQVPIIMLTARVDEVDRLLGLEVGADDYVCKPFSPREVVARAKVHLRRSGMLKAPETLPRCRVDRNQMCIFLDGIALNLTPVEFRLLAELITCPERVFSRQQLLDFAHEDQRDVNDRTVDSHIKNIRRKLQQQLPDQEYLHSVYGVGYRFEMPNIVTTVTNERSNAMHKETPKTSASE